MCCAGMIMIALVVCWGSNQTGLVCYKGPAFLLLCSMPICSMTLNLFKAGVAFGSSLVSSSASFDWRSKRSGHSFWSNQIRALQDFTRTQTYTYPLGNFIFWRFLYFAFQLKINCADPVPASWKCDGEPDDKLTHHIIPSLAPHTRYISQENWVDTFALRMWPVRAFSLVQYQHVRRSCRWTETLLDSDWFTSGILAWAYFCLTFGTAIWKPCGSRDCGRACSLSKWQF